MFQAICMVAAGGLLAFAGGMFGMESAASAGPVRVGQGVGGAPSTQPAGTIRPGQAIGPFVGVGRGEPLTPAQAAEERKQEVLTLLRQYLGDDLAMRASAAIRLGTMGKEALPVVESAGKGLEGEAQKRYEALVAGLKADAAARDAVQKYLKEKHIAGGELSVLVDPALHEAFPKSAFYVLRFRQFPVAHEVPAGMQPSNALVVKPDGNVEPLPDAQAAKAFFKEALPPVKDAAGARAAASAWLRISQEWRQDGFFNFVESDVDVTPGNDGKGQVAAARAEVKGGGNSGEIKATLVFGAEGKLVSVSDEGQVKEGIRPICQATKLLDPDPIVRGMAEQSILVMGRRARDYLIEQRAKAAPALQAEIDRVWQRVVDEGR